MDKIMAIWIGIGFIFYFIMSMQYIKICDDGITSIKVWIAPIILVYKSLKNKYTKAGVVIAEIFITILTLPWLCIGMGCYILVLLLMVIWLLFNVLFKKDDEQ